MKDEVERHWAGSDYVRVYHTIKTDPKFNDIWGDKVALGWYLTLLISADQAYPVPADLPRSLPDEELNKLTDAGLVILVSTDQFTISGMRAEREARIDHQSKAGKARAAGAERDSKGHFVQRAGELLAQPAGPSPSQHIQPSKAEQSKAKQSINGAQARVLDEDGREMNGPELAREVIRRMVLGKGMVVDGNS